MIEQSAGGPGRLRIPKEAGIGGFPNSCYIWRSEGKMTQVRQARVQATEDADFENVED